MKMQFTKKLFSLLLALLIVVGMLPVTAQASVSGDGWYIIEEESPVLCVTGKLTSLPAYGYYSITIVSSGELALSDSEVWKYEVANGGTISGGTFQGAVENRGTISGGTFGGTVKNWGTISGGTFKNSVENTYVGTISGGSFQEAVKNSRTISGGTFHGIVENDYYGTISDGTFRLIVMNDGCISGGAFLNTVSNSTSGLINGGAFEFAVHNNGLIEKAKLLGADVIGNNPVAVIHNVNGEDKPLQYGSNLLDELGDADEGNVWYAGDVCVDGGTVPLSYTQYSQKAHTHNYVYTVSGNMLTETCANGCNHTAKATLTIPKESYTYTGEFIMPAVLTFDENWKGSIGKGYTYTNNKDVGIATVTSNPAGKIISTTFEIKAADIAGASITFNPASSDYNGNEQKPTISVTWNNKSLVEGTDYTAFWDKNGFTESDNYTVTVTGKGNFEGTAEKTFSIAQKEVGISWGSVNFLPYTGQLVLPEVSITGLADGDICEAVVSVVETVDGAGINPGKWTARITGLTNGNYKLPENSNLLEVQYTIYAQQTAPAVSGADETIKGKNDGYISGLTTDMEYAAEYTNRNDAYTPVTDPDMLFAPGTYYVRYAAKDYYYASPATEVTIAEGRKLTVTLPQTQVGYTLTVDKTEFAYNDSLHFTFSLHDGYTMTDDFSAKLNDMPLPVHYGNTVVDSCYEDFVVTVRGVADITPPAVEIKVKENKWTSFWNNLTFGLFFKETQDVTITTTDKGSGVKSVQYYLYGRELERDEVRSITDWIDYNGVFKINPDNRYVIYAKVTDNAGNVEYINSEGIVLDATAPVLYGIEDGGVYHGDKVFKAMDENFLKIEVDGVDITDTTEGDDEFKIAADNAEHTVTVTDKAGNVTEYKITVYKKYMVTYTDGEGGSYEKNFNYGEVITIPTNEIFNETFRKAGYTLTGWQGYTEGMTMPLEDVTFTAVYTPNNYAVAFDANGGESVAPITVTYGEKYGNLPSSAVAGLSGGNKNWYLVDANGNVTETNIKKLTQVSTARDHTLFMKRTVLAPNVSIQLTVPGGISDDYKYYIPGASQRVLTATVKNGNTELLNYTYQWYKDAAPIAGATADVLTLEGNVADSGTYKVEVTATLKNGSNIVVTSDTATASKELSVKILHAANTISYDANGGEGGPQSAYTGGIGLAVSKDAPTREHYNFIGWNTASDGTGQGYQAEDVYTFVNDGGNGGCVVTLYAQWKPVEYTVTYMADGQTVSTESVEYGKDATLPNVPAKDGFVGKWDGDGKNIAGDTTISAVYLKLPVVKPDEVKIEDKTDLADAKAKLEEELQDDAYTEDNKEKIQGVIDNIDDALAVIANVENVEELIDKLPDTITKSDEPAIKAADRAYNALTDYEKSLVGKAAKKALDTAKAALAELKKPVDGGNKPETDPEGSQPDDDKPAADSDSHQTGDNSHLTLWTALLFVSGMGIIAVILAERKRRTTNN